MMLETPSGADAGINAADGLRYWGRVSADENGMLGGVPLEAGFGGISRIDLQGSRTFLARLGIGAKGGREGVEVALEGGAGIGRVTKGLLLNIAKQVDVIEPVARFTQELQTNPQVRHVHNCGLQDWHPDEGTYYDLVWVQWCVGHLTDDELVRFLERCRDALTRSGVLVVKENLASGDEDVFDPEDSSVTRRDEKFRRLFERAGLRLVRTDVQRGLPEGGGSSLLPVRMYALRQVLLK